ncbi:unnamed protein product [Ixodes pacificus]
MKKRKCTLLKIVHFQRPRQGTALPHSLGSIVTVVCPTSHRRSPRVHSKTKQTKNENHAGVPALHNTNRMRQTRENVADGAELWDSGETGTSPKQKKPGTGEVRGEGKRSSLHLP